MDTLIESGWNREGNGWISPVRHHRPRKGKHDSKVWQYGPNEWAVACTGCGFNLAPVDEETARDAGANHWRPNFEFPVTAEILYTNKGHEVEVTMTDKAAVEILAKGRNNFGRELVKVYSNPNRSWSAIQRAWAHLLANQASQPKASKSDNSIDLSDLYGFMAAAGENLKYPTINISDELQIKYMTGGKNRGKILVTDGRKYPNNSFYGYIESDGSYSPHRNTPDTVVAGLKSFNEDPEGEAKSYGRKTGNCCFCHRELSTKESLAVGYGPICADNYGLPWG